jgi:hypothetical protein
VFGCQRLVVEFDEGQQCQMTRAFYFACQFTLAASAASGLAARLNFASFADETLKRVNVFIIEAASFGAVVAAGASTSPAPAGTIFALVAVAAIHPIATAIQSITAAIAVTSTTAPAAVSSTTPTRAVVSIKVHVGFLLH